MGQDGRRGREWEEEKSIRIYIKEIKVLSVMLFTKEILGTIRFWHDYSMKFFYF